MSNDRKELVDWVRGIYQNLNDAEKRDAIRFFPELRNSEDERIRQTLIDMVKRETGFTGFPSQGQVLAYLERQKEHVPENEESGTRKEPKPAIMKPHKGDDGNPYDMGVSEAQDYAINRGFGIPLNDGEVFVDERHITQTIGNILRWADEHPKEQKPALTPERIHPKFAVGDTVCRPMWSEHTIREIYVRCDDPVYVCVNEEGTESHISLSEQDEWERKEQKPAWSKEDERKYYQLEYSMRAAGTIPDHLIQWALKSLRPSWKPSEEQMEALEECGQCKRCIKELYEQLKKLM